MKSFIEMAKLSSSPIEINFYWNSCIKAKFDDNNIDYIVFDEKTNLPIHLFGPALYLNPEQFKLNEKGSLSFIKSFLFIVYYAE